MDTRNAPNFHTLSRTELAVLAANLWAGNIHMHGANEQLRLTNRDLSEQLRKFIKEPTCN